MHLKPVILALAIIFITNHFSYAQSETKNGTINVQTIEQMIKKGKFKDAAAGIDKLVAAGTKMSPELLYEYARIYANAGENTKSLKFLSEAIDKGFWYINRLKEDKELNTSLGASEMEKVLANLRAVSAPYLSGKAILTKAEKKSLIDLTTRGLKSLYFDTAKATEMSAEITRMFDAGHFDGVDTVSAFTSQLVNYLRKKTS
ncbi:MAG TPA: hypothetical protein VKB19_09590, partial [Pedobacter sp.]|nr:hypothetical protein [Pedobacter sp.]